MRAPLHVLVVAVLAVMPIAACSDDDPPDATPTPAPSGTTTTPQEPCELTATVEGVGYHVRGVYGDYEADDSVDLQARLSPCAGVEGEVTRFYRVVGVKQEWAVVTVYEDRPVFMVSDDLPPIPAESDFARILVGDFAD